jgi:hypothetical protein
VTTEEQTPPVEGGKKNILSDWKGMKGWQKAGVLIGAGALIVAILLYFKGQSSGTASVGNAGSILGNVTPSQFPGEGDTFPSVPSLNQGPGAGSTTTIPTSSLPSFTNIGAGTAGTGLLGAGTTVFDQNGSVFAMQPGGGAVNVNTILPAGASVFGGGQGRYWYELPGSSQQLLLTSGAGSPVSTGKGSPIGVTQPPPKTAWKV